MIIKKVLQITILLIKALEDGRKLSITELITFSKVVKNTHTHLRMIVLREVKPVLKIMGIVPTKNLPLLTSMTSMVLISSFLIGVTIPSGAYLLKNITDITKITDASYVMAAMIMSFFQYWCIIFQREEFNILLNDLQCIVDSSEYR